MSNIRMAAPAAAPQSGISIWMKRHPLVAFFALAYGLAWVLWIPLLVLSRDGIGWLPIQVPAVPLVVLGGFSPMAAAIIMTAVLEGRAAVGRLLRRCLQWRVAFQWYLLAIFLVPVAFLIVSVLLGYISLAAVIQKWPLLLTFYPLVLIPQVILGGGLGEEPGWRGFALPRMQSSLGALPASLLLGALHACWHIPLFFVPTLSQGHLNFLLFVLVGMAISVLMTWVYNNTGGSLLIMMLLHEAEDTTSAMSLRIAPQFLDRTPAYLMVYGVVALAVMIATRATLSYRGGRSQRKVAEVAMQEP